MDINLPLPVLLVVGMILSIVVFQLAVLLYQKVKSPLLNPLLVTLVVLIAALSVLHIPYDAYEASVQVFSFMLGPATVALAYSVWRQRSILKSHFIPIVSGCLVGSIVSMISAYTLCTLLGLGDDMAVSFIPKSVTTPIAIAASQELHYRRRCYYYRHSWCYFFTPYGKDIPRARSRGNRCCHRHLFACSGYYEGH